jgi:hypothetical protein
MNRPSQGRDHFRAPRGGRRLSCNANTVQPRSTHRGIGQIQSPSSNRRHERPWRWYYNLIISPHRDVLALEITTFEDNVLRGNYDNLDMSIIYHPLIH